MEFTYSVESVTSGQTYWTEKDECNLSKFDKLLRSQWDAAMKAGYFRYSLDHIQTKILAGKYKFVAQLNTKRATDRRKAETISSIDQPFDHDRFNFSKIKEHEILFELKPVNNHVMIGDMNVHDKTTKDEDTHNPHLAVINISPLEYCNILLVPHVKSCYPQECRQLAGTLYETTDWPVRSFVLQLAGSDVQNLTSDIHKVTSYLHGNNIAHNLFLSRGECLEKRPGERTIRAYIWPRQSSYGAKIFTSFNPAVCELAGHLPVKCGADYRTLTEETVVQILKGVSLPDQQFAIIKENIQKLF